MGLFERRIKPDTNLSGIATERLLREYAKHANAAGYLNYINQQSEFSTKENPTVMDAQAFGDSMEGIMIRASVAEELKRRGIEPPD